MHTACVLCVGVARGAPKGPRPLTFLENIDILFFERVFLNKIVLFAYNQTFWLPPKFWAGYATGPVRFLGACG